MGPDDPIYWSHIATFEECRQKFLWQFGWDGIDLGEGPGKGKKFPDITSRHDAVMGKVIQKAVEKFYNEELWRDPSAVSDILMGFVEREWRRQIKKRRNFIDYEKAGLSDSEMIEVCKDGVRGYLVTMKRHRLLGTYARAEVRMLGWLNKWVTVAGIADVIVRRTDTGITITEGKNTRHKMRYTNPDQLRWYALVFWRAHGEMPNRLGFVWYRFPAGHETFDVETGQAFQEEGVEWIPFEKEDLLGLARRAIDARNAMRKHKFDPVPVPDTCKWCNFESVCEARQEQREKNASRRRPKNLKELEDADGFADLEL